MTEVQGEGNVVYSVVCVCVVQDERNVVYIDVSVVQDEGNVVYSDV